MFKRTLVSLGLVLSMVSALHAQESNAESQRIYWTDSVQLQWSDFQAKPEKSEKIAALSSIALPYGFSTDGEGEIMIEMRVCFIKNESWSKVEERNDVLLKHEQLHFDIAELHRRKIVKALKEVSFTKKNYEEKLDNIVAQYWSKQYRKMQDQYDQETNFSQVIKSQLSWMKEIEKELQQLSEFSEEEFTLSLINFED